MSKAPYRVTGQYSYKYACRLCGLVRLFSDMARRWDGLMVCRDTCWEPRNILDFYRTRDDTHKLEETNRDLIPAGSTMDGVTGGWNPALSNIVYDPGVVQLHGDYRDDTINSPTIRTLSFQVQIPFGNTLTFCFANNPTNIILPTSPTTAGTYTLMTNHGVILRSGTIPSGSATLSVTGNATVVSQENLLFAGRYGL